MDVPALCGQWHDQIGFLGFRQWQGSPTPATGILQQAAFFAAVCALNHRCMIQSQIGQKSRQVEQEYKDNPKDQLCDVRSPQPTMQECKRGKNCHQTKINGY